MKIKAILAVSVLAVGIAASGAAQTTSQDSEIQVNVTETVQLDARPTVLEYGQSGTGISLGDTVTTSDNGHEHIDIENIGSVPIDAVHAESTMPLSQPFGDKAENFDTGNFFVMSTQTAQNDYSIDGVGGPTNLHYLNRVSYEEENPPEYLFTEPTGDSVTDGSTTYVSSVSDVDVGRFRVGSAEYFWVLYSGQNDGSTGSTDSWALRIAESPKTPTEDGTRDFRNPDAVTGDVKYFTINASSASDAGATGVSRVDSINLVTFNTDSSTYTGQELLDGKGTNSTAMGEVDGATSRAYNLYVDGANNQTIRTSFNTQLTDPGDDWTADTYESGDQQYIFKSTSDPLQPGQNFPIDVGIEVPQGVDRSRISPGTVTILATESVA